MKTIGFEHTGKYITAFDDDKVLIRCDFDYTDCRDDEPLPAFIKRHGGVEDTIVYLHEAYTEGWC